MTGQRPTPDDGIRDWIMSGPELASTEFVERTLRPIPRMRQRRSWRIALEHLVRPIAAPAGALVGVTTVVAVGIGALVLLPRVGGTGSPSATPPLRPTFDLRVSAGPDAGAHVPLGAGTYVADDTTSLDVCSRAPDGSWRYLYSGGTPYVNLDVLIGAGAGQAGQGDRVAFELNAGATYVVVDPADLRGGDPPGRSQATVVVHENDGTTTFVIDAITPDRSSGDVPSVKVDLTLTCPT